MSKDIRLSVVKSIRLSREVNDVLEAEAERRRVNFNQLLSSILVKFCEWDRFMEKMGCVPMTRNLYREFMEYLPEDKWQKVSVDTATRVKEALFLWYKRADLRSFLEFFPMWLRYGFGVQCDLRENGKNTVISIHHEFGMKWSTSITYFMEEMKATLRVDPKIQITENMMVVTFPNDADKLQDSSDR